MSLKSSELAFRILKLQEKVDEKIKKISETRGKLEAMQQQLQQFGISDIKEAQKKLDEIEHDIEQIKERLSSKLSKLEEKYDL